MEEAMLSFQPPRNVEDQSKVIPYPGENPEEITPQRNLPELVSLIREHFDRAKQHKSQHVDERLLNCVYAFKSEYTPKKLMSIRDLGGSEAYIPITNMKVRAGKAWLTDIFFRPRDPIFSLKP
ncbi:hypothetical protein DRN93_01710, partial [archaeon]